jgi:hypothetical protein
MIMNMHTLKTVDVFGYSYDPCTTMNAAIATPKKIDVIVTYHRNQRALRFVRGLIGMTRFIRWTSGNAGLLRIAAPHLAASHGSACTSHNLYGEGAMRGAEKEDKAAA